MRTISRRIDLRRFIAEIPLRVAQGLAGRSVQQLYAPGLHASLIISAGVLFAAGAAIWFGTATTKANSA
jgi:hypothetical protein